MMGDEQVKSALYGILANNHNRAVIKTIETADDHTNIDRDTLIEAFTDRFDIKQSQAMALLHHSILPRLNDAGLIAYNPDDGTITVTDTSTVNSLIEIDRDADEIIDDYQ